MSETKKTSFDIANEKVHKVETQWHYPIMTKYGFDPVTKDGTGFVRSYRYVNKNGYEVIVTTGYHADHWSCEDEHGLWSTLEPFLKMKFNQ